MTQMQLAKLSGYPQPQISRWECGADSPGRQAVIDLADALGIEPRNLYAE